MPIIILTQIGLAGISGISNDMRTLLEMYSDPNAPRAKLAVDMFCLRIKKYIGSYVAVLGGRIVFPTLTNCLGIDHLIFTGGIGENSPRIRELICNDLSLLGIELDPIKNIKQELMDHLEVSKEGRTKVYVVPTNEELVIARETFKLIAT